MYNYTYTFNNHPEFLDQFLTRAMLIESVDKGEVLGILNNLYE